jgi:hypothetical protein
MQEAQNIVKKNASKMSVPTTFDHIKYLSNPRNPDSDMQAGMAITAVIIIDQTGACHLSLT